MARSAQQGPLARGDSGPVARGDSDWEGVRLHVVTGKGGVGKTTIATALAMAIASDGRRVLLVEVEGRQGIARLFERDPLPYAEVDIARLPNTGGTVRALAIDPQEALLEYLATYYKLGAAARALRRIGAIDFATTIAPGLRDVLLTGKVYEAVRRREGGGHKRTGNRRALAPYVYDAVVVDAPPTGRITRFLGVNAEVAGLARVGPIRKQADSIMGVIRSPSTAVHLVTRLEEMPVQETLDGIAEIRRAGLPLGGIVVNAARDRVLPPGRLREAAGSGLDADEVRRGLSAAGLRPAAATVTALAAEANQHAHRVLVEARLATRLRRTRLPVYTLPTMPAIDPDVIHDLAGLLGEQGAT